MFHTHGKVIAVKTCVVSRHNDAEQSKPYDERFEWHLYSWTYQEAPSLNNLLQRWKKSIHSEMIGPF